MRQVLEPADSLSNWVDQSAEQPQYAVLGILFEECEFNLFATENFDFLRRKDKGYQLFTSIHRALVRQWLRRYRKQKVVPSVRAIFLGDAVSTQIILDGVYEKYELEVLEEEVFTQLSPASTCLDIGANIGNHANFFSKHFARVIAFEPNPMVHAVLVANTFGSNVITISKGLSDTRCEVPFQQDFANLGASRIVEPSRSAVAKINVIPLDDLVEEYALSDVSFVKIDVENHELQALRGATNFLSKNRPIIAMEAFCKEFPERGKKIEDLLRGLGYKYFYRLTPRSQFVNRLEGTPMSAKRGIMRMVLPEKMRKSLKLEETFEVAGSDHQLLIIAHNPLRCRL